MDQAILRGLENYIRANLSEWNKDNCQATPDARPAPIICNQFCSLHITESQGTTDDQGLLEEVWGFGVTVTKRIEAVPHDKIVDTIYLQQSTGIARLVRQLKYAINNRGEVQEAINDELQKVLECDIELQQFICSARLIRPPIWTNRNAKFIFRDEVWMRGSHSQPTRDRHDGHVAISYTLNFGRLNFQLSQTEGTCS